MRDWNQIETLPTTEELVLAWCPPDATCADGRMMIWRGKWLAKNIEGPTPGHLQFPATHWMPLPKPPMRPNGQIQRAP